MSLTFNMSLWRSSIIVLLSAIGFAGFSVAQAATGPTMPIVLKRWREIRAMSDFEFALLGCQQVSKDTTVCHTKVTLKERDARKTTIPFSDFKIINTAGQEKNPLWMSVAGSKLLKYSRYGSIRKTAYSNLPLDVLTAYKFSGEVLPGLMIHKKIFQNIPVKPIKPDKQPEAEASSIKVPPPPPMQSADYRADFSNCQKLADGKLSCTAMLSPN